jgi:tetratricopeptide (TPR) repeat protein
MPDKPDFIVDPAGKVQDVRGQNNPSPKSSSQQPEPGPSITAMDKNTRSNQRPSGGFILIPIGLIFTVIIMVLRGLSGPGKENSYPESDVNSLNSGIYSYNQGDYGKALMYFNLAIASQPDMGEAYNDRGLTYQAMGEIDKAVSDFTRAIELLPNPAVAYSNRGGIYLSTSNTEQALVDLDKAIELSPCLAVAYQNRGLTHLNLGNYDQAIVDFDQAIELTPEFKFSLQATLENQRPVGGNDLSGLINGQNEADLPIVYANRAIAFLQIGDPERAVADLEKATQLGLDPAFAQQVRALLPKAVLVPQTGHWEGISYHSGYQGTVSFDIGTDGLVHDFKLDLIFATGNSCLVSADDILLQPDDSFSFTFGMPETEGGNIILGLIESSTNVLGIFSRHIKCISTTGEDINGELSPGASWSAEWVSSLWEPAN